MKFKYLVYDAYQIWGKHDISKEYLINAVQRDACIVDTENSTYFNAEQNAWLPIQGDEGDTNDRD